MKTRIKIWLLVSSLVLISSSVYFASSRRELKADFDTASSASKKINNPSKSGNIDAEVEVYPFDESVNKSDLIVEVQIKEKIKETDDPSPKTIFKTEIINILTQKEPLATKEINIMQAGNSKWSFNDNKLFSPGEKYILFLKRTVDFDIENTFWILGEETNIYEITDENKIVKWSRPQKELESFEDKELNFKKAAEYNEPDKESQILEKDGFQDYIQ
ncbi:hypothetical protein [Paenibacillus sp. S150]|uniref:hypothetical protein n=1 Tax=Paenibacillus sp. S150 TaxID=2749826 RepID=UPI001C577FE4|nr:hypothetical protein [Paenibacillus sp. S150]MBW4081228.1 hypothetical protein [Paenibacillus sp. S150]